MHKLAGRVCFAGVSRSPALCFAFYYVTTNCEDDDEQNSPNHPVGTLSDVTQVRVTGAHVEKLALDGLAPGLMPRRGSHISGRSGGGGAAGANGRCGAARIRHSFLSSPLLLCRCATLYAVVSNTETLLS